jgi:hypothetical protein
MCAHVSGSNKSVVIIVAQSRSAVVGSRETKGSLDPDTRCCYCGITLAVYIADGTAGPICGECITTRVGWAALVRKRHQRLINGLIRSCGKTADVQLKLPRDAHLTIAALLWLS